MTQHDEFYIGYEARIPTRTARCVAAAIAVAVVALLVTAAAVTRSQAPLADSSFAFGVIRSWSGWLERTPAPALLVPSGNGITRFWLVGRGKHGASAVLAGVDEGWVRVEGSQLTREPWRMIEVTSAAPGEAAPGARPFAPDTTAAGPDVVVRGEIVDSKCFLGAMNPGERTVHRDCAIRCLSGGVPPMLSFTDQSGRAALAVIVNADGHLLHDDLHGLVGRPITARGRVGLINGQPVFQLASVSGAGR